MGQRVWRVFWFSRRKGNFGRHRIPESCLRWAVTTGGRQHSGRLSDADTQAFFDNVLQAFLAVLNEISSTLQLLVVYWTSFKLLQIHELLPPLPGLVELHINRSSILKRDIYEEPPTTVLFLELMSISVSGDNPRKLSCRDELARVLLRIYLLYDFPCPTSSEYHNPRQM